MTLPNTSVPDKVQRKIIIFERDMANFEFRVFLPRMLKCLLLYKEYGGALGVMIIVIGSGHGDTSSNPGRDRLHFTSH